MLPELKVVSENFSCLEYLQLKYAAVNNYTAYITEHSKTDSFSSYSLYIRETQNAGLICTIELSTDINIIWLKITLYLFLLLHKFSNFSIPEPFQTTS